MYDSRLESPGALGPRTASVSLSEKWAALREGGATSARTQHGPGAGMGRGARVCNCSAPSFPKPEGGERETENSYLLARSPDAFSDRGWAGLKPGAWSPAQLSCVGDRSPPPSQGSRQQKPGQEPKLTRAGCSSVGCGCLHRTASACLPPGALTGSVPRTSAG